MTTQEKLKRLAQLHNKRAVSIAAGLAPNTFHGILRKNRVNLSARTAAALARTFGVDLTWLLDERAGWPPRRVETGDRDRGPEPIAA